MQGSRKRSLGDSIPDVIGWGLIVAGRSPLRRTGPTVADVFLNIKLYNARWWRMYCAEAAAKKRKEVVERECGE